MCFYDQSVWTCGYWKWGKFRERCHKENRIGETCGLKLVYKRDDQTTACKLCERITAKRRQIERETERMEKLHKWHLLASYAKCKEKVASFNAQVAELDKQHSTKMRGGAAVRLKPIEPRIDILGPEPHLLLPAPRRDYLDRAPQSSLLSSAFASKRQQQQFNHNRHDNHSLSANRPTGVRKRIKSTGLTRLMESHLVCSVIEIR